MDSNKGFGAFWTQTKRNFSDTNGLLWALLFIFLTTFIVFPAVLEATTFKFLHGVNQEFSWFVLICSTIFNIGDTIGRKMGGVPAFFLSDAMTIILSLARVIFVVTFMMTTWQVKPDWLWDSDWFKIINQLLFSFSNGYLSTLCAIKAPGAVEGERKGQVGAFIGITISTGIMLGSLVAVPVGKFIADSPGEIDALNMG